MEASQPDNTSMRMPQVKPSGRTHLCCHSPTDGAILHHCVTLHEAGYSIHKMAGMVGVPHDTMQRILRKNRKAMVPWRSLTDHLAGEKPHVN